MKEKLLKLLQCDPATAGRPDDFLDTLAEDIQAVIIRAVVPAPREEAEAELEYRVTSVLNDVFGTSLYNLFTTQRFDGKKVLGPAGRKTIVAAMLQTMLLENDRADEWMSYSESGEHAATLKRRLSDTVVEFSPTIH